MNPFHTRTGFDAPHRHVHRDPAFRIGGAGSSVKPDPCSRNWGARASRPQFSASRRKPSGARRPHCSGMSAACRTRRRDADGSDRDGRAPPIPTESLRLSTNDAANAGGPCNWKAWLPRWILWTRTPQVDQARGSAGSHRRPPRCPRTQAFFLAPNSPMSNCAAGLWNRDQP